MKNLSPVSAKIFDLAIAAREQVETDGGTPPAGAFVRLLETVVVQDEDLGGTPFELDLRKGTILPLVDTNWNDEHGTWEVFAVIGEGLPAQGLILGVDCELVDDALEA